VVTDDKLVYGFASSARVITEEIVASALMSDQLDRVAPQPHLTLRLEHEQKHADLLARHLGAGPGMTWQTGRN
jgi:hypothetical protein